MIGRNAAINSNENVRRARPLRIKSRGSGSQPISIVRGDADEGTVAGHDDVVAAGFGGQRRAALAVRSFTVQVVARVERHEVAVLAHLAFRLSGQRVEV